MGYWRTKVLPTMKKLLEKFPSKKTVSGEASKTFDDSKEAINKEIEEKKTELGPKVVEIYEASSAEVKTLLKNPIPTDLKKPSAEVQKFIDDLIKIEFPGAKVASEVSSTLGVTGPITFILEKVSLFLPAEEKSREITEEIVKTEEPAKEEEIKTEEIIIEKDKEIVQDKKKEEVTPPAPAPAVSPATAPAAAPVEVPKAAPVVAAPVVAAPVEAPKAAPAVAAEEKKPVVLEVKKEAEIAAVPAVTAVKAPETSKVETPVKAPVTSAAVPPKA